MNWEAIGEIRFIAATTLRKRKKTAASVLPPRRNNDLCLSATETMKNTASAINRNLTDVNSFTPSHKEILVIIPFFACNINPLRQFLHGRGITLKKPFAEAKGHLRRMSYFSSL